MGLFDESDSDEEPTNSANNVANDGIGGGDDEEEDPLDAFMSTLSDAPTSTSSRMRNASNSSGEGRLDVDAEDEATSHWEIGTKSKMNAGVSSDNRLLPKHKDDNERVDGSGSTPQVMTGFVRAGGKKQSSKNSNNHPKNALDDDGGEEEIFDNLQSVRAHQQQLLHSEIDPLEKVNHKSIQYNAFNRIFYKPTDTQSGHAWRKEHEVVCTPSNFDPILSFGELGPSRNGSDGIVFPEELIRTIAQQGYDSPTLVQSQTLSVALNGNDALVTASTGSGKTVSYDVDYCSHLVYRSCNTISKTLCFCRLH